MLRVGLLGRLVIGCWLARKSGMTKEPVSWLITCGGPRRRRVQAARLGSSAVSTTS